MKKIDLRDYVLMKNRPAGYWEGKEIIACGLMGGINRYWIETEDKMVTGLTRIAQVMTRESRK